MPAVDRPACTGESAATAGEDFCLTWRSCHASRDLHRVLRQAIGELLAERGMPHAAVQGDHRTAHVHCKHLGLGRLGLCRDILNGCESIDLGVEVSFVLILPNPVGLRLTRCRVYSGGFLGSGTGFGVLDYEPSASLCLKAAGHSSAMGYAWRGGVREGRS
jgi:hypothetical protein